VEYGTTMMHPSPVQSVFVGSLFQRRVGYFCHYIITKLNVLGQHLQNVTKWATFIEFDGINDFILRAFYEKLVNYMFLNSAHKAKKSNHISYNSAVLIF
jgi:hypothetical protein